MSRFGDDPRAFFDALYQGVAPWDVGEPQPGITALLEDFPPVGPVLDLGCGTGDLSIRLAERGLTVLGIDFAAGAIEQARSKASSLPAAVASLLEFQVADGLQAGRLGTSFGAVVDCGFLHLFDADGRDALVRELATVLAPGGRYYLLAFAVEFPVDNTPMQVREEEVHARFTAAAGWNVLEVRPARFLARVAPPVPALAACVERTSASGVQ